MAVAQLIETLDAGGAEALAIEIANALATRGRESHLIVIAGGGCFQSRVHESVHLHDLGSPRSTGRLPARALYFIRTFRKLSSLVADNHIDVIQSHLPKANFFGLALAALHRAKVHPTVHNNREFEYGDSPNRYIERGRRAAYRLMLRCNAPMIAVSDEVKAAMAVELGVDGTARADRIVAVPNGVKCPEPPAPGDRERARAGWGVGEDELLLVAAGRLTRQKNFASLLDSLTCLPNNVPKWKCVVAGEGELRSELLEQVRELNLEGRVVLPGHVDGLRDLLAAADVYCLSSLYEGLPLVMLEAMAASVPVCAFGIRGAADVVTHEREGLLVEPGDTEAFAAGLARLLGDVQLRHRLGEAARSLVRSTYSFDRMVDSLVALYD